MRNARAISRGLPGLLAAFLMALLAGQPVLSALPVHARDHRGCECGHGSCPMRRPAKATPSCHGAHSEPAPVETGDSGSLSATCGCGHKHSPGTPHRENPAELVLVLAGRLPAPADLVASRPGPGPSIPLPVPDPPPPRA